MSLRSIVRAIQRQNASQQISKERMWVKKRAFCLYETHQNKYVISCIVWTSNSKTIFHNKCHRWRVDESTILEWPSQMMRTFYRLFMLQCNIFDSNGSRFLPTRERTRAQSCIQSIDCPPFVHHTVNRWWINYCRYIHIS